MDTKKEPLYKCKFYADAPDGTTKNKPMNYKVYDIEHAVNILEKFVRNGWKIRAAYVETGIGTNKRIPNSCFM